MKRILDLYTQYNTTGWGSSRWGGLGRLFGNKQTEVNLEVGGRYSP